MNYSQTSPQKDQDNRQKLSWIDRNGFNHLSVSFAWLLTAWLPMQILVSIVVVLVMMATGVINISAIEEIGNALQAPELLITINSSWQIFALGIGTLLMVKLHAGSEGIRGFIRSKSSSNNVIAVILAVLLVASIQPLVWYLGWLNSLIPAPEFFEQMQASQMEFIDKLLRGDYSLVFILFNIAVVPAICEEILFRGYIMRSFEKHTSAFWAIAGSSLLFGLFHLQITHLLPLTAVGLLLALLVYYTNSLWPAVVAHFTNNASAVIYSKYFPESSLAAATPETPPSLWWVLLSVIMSALFITFLVKQFRSAR